jgi:hypothetical protein
MSCTDRSLDSASAAAVPAAWPITKQAPVTRAADCPSCDRSVHDIDRQELQSRLARDGVFLGRKSEST